MKLPHLFAGLLLAAPLVAAPPAVTTLTPAGGQRGMTVNVSATGTFDQWPAKVWCDTPGVTVTAEKEKGKFAVNVAVDVPLGAVWLRFHDDSGASDLRPFIVGALPEQAEAEPNDDAKTAPAVTLPKVVNGVLAKSGDVDCFAVTLKKGQTLVASLEAHRTLRSPVDAVLQVTSADGTVIEQNHDARGLDPELAFTAPADGTYVVRVFGFPATPDSSIRHFGSPACVYRLTLTTDEFVDFVTPLAVERGKDATLALHGWNLSAKTAKLDKSAAAFGLAHPFPVAREPHPCFDGAPTDTPLSPPFALTGRVEKAGVAVAVPITVEAGKPFAVQLDSATLGLSLTPVLTVTDSTGKQLLKAEPAALGGGIDAAFTPPKAGGCNIEVRDLFKSAGPRHVFRLRVVPAVPDVSATVAADRFTVAVGTPLDVPVTYVKKNGFTADVTAFAEGLPDGVTASAVEAAKPDGKTAMLRLTATKAGVGGPIRIGVGKRGDDTTKRVATAALPAYDRPTADLWLTVPPAAKK